MKSEYIHLGAKEETLFDDIYEYEKKGFTFPNKIHFHRGEAIDAIQLEYEGGKLSKQGGNGGDPIHFALGKGEYITSITGTTMDRYWNNTFILSLIFHTNQGHAFGVSGSYKDIPTEGKPFEIKFPEHMGLACLFGGFAHPFELKTGVVKETSLLSTIGAYLKEY